MAKHAAFLRAINLGSRRRVSGAELRSQFEQLGLGQVDTFRTSGNVVFDAGREPLARMGARIEAGLAKGLGYEVGVFLRTASQIRALAEQQPFSRKLVAASSGKLQVLLLTKKPAARVRQQVLAEATAEDRLEFAERELFWLPSGGIRDSKLDLSAIERLIGPTTMRTKGTVEQLAAKYFSA